MTTITYADRRDDVDHATRMRVRRARQLARTPGFTPVPNARIEASIKGMTGILTIAHQKSHDENGTAMPSAAQIHSEAVRAVAKTLPPVPLGVRTRPYGSRSKY